MNPEIGRRWVRALRSGNYKQGKGRLTHLNADGSPASHCCLGVLCDLAAKDGIVFANVEHFSATPTRVYVAANPNDRGTKYLPEAVMRWAGLERYNPRVSVPAVGSSHLPSQRVTTTLASLNDERGYDFNQIADIVEEQLMGEKVPA